MQVIELQGISHVLVQSDGKTFRIFSRETKHLDDSLVSEGIKNEEKLGGIRLIPDEVNTTVSKSSVPPKIKKDEVQD